MHRKLTTDAMPQSPEGSSPTLVEVLGALLALLMIFQQVVIARASDEPWEPTARKYKRHLRVASVVAVFLICVVSTMYVLLRKDYSAYEQLFSPNRSLLMVVCVTFFAAILRLLLERATDEPREFGHFVKDLIRSFVGTIDPTRPLPQVDHNSRARRYDSWVWAFSLLVGIEVVVHLIPSATALLSGWQLFVTIVGVNLVVAIAYFGWIYLGAFRKMTDVHHFSGIAAREYLGKLFEETIPYQAVVIGPMRAGKTSFCEGKSIPSSKATSKLQASRFATAGEMSPDRGCSAYVSLLDTPGENLGDHLAAISYYRTDVLVLVVRAEGFRIDLLSRAASKDLSNLESYWVGEGQHASGTRDYLSTLKKALRRDEDPNSITRSFDMYKVRRFILFLNCQGMIEDEMQRFMASDALQSIAVLLGERFGVKPENCFALAAASINGGAARDRVVKTYSLRKEIDGYKSSGSVAKPSAASLPQKEIPQPSQEGVAGNTARRDPDKKSG